MEFSMRNCISYAALAVALTAGTSVAHAQTVETVVAPPPATVIAQQPVVTMPAPVETIKTVRTVSTTTTPARRIVRHVRNRVTTTRTTVSETIVPAPVGPAVAAVVRPGLYDVAGPAAVVGAAPMVGAPAYRYVYEPDRILVIDPYTNIAVQAIPR
jgi:hypothetical protein